MGERVLDPLKIAMWLALVLVLALTIMAQHGPTMLPTVPSHSAGHSDHGQPVPDHATCVLACIAFVEVLPAPIAVPMRLLGGLAKVPAARLLVGHDLEWAGRPPWFAGP